MSTVVRTAVKRAAATRAPTSPAAGKIARNAAATAAAAPPRTLTSSVSLTELMHAYRVEVPKLVAESTGKGSRPGTPMQRAVWAAVYCVPKGYVGTYASIGYAAKWILKNENNDTIDEHRTPEDDNIERPGGLFAQSVGQALKRNPAAPLVPCHRCVRVDGNIGGFCGHTTGDDIHRKVALLRSEGAQVNADRDTFRVARTSMLTL